MCSLDISEWILYNINIKSKKMRKIDVIDLATMDLYYDQVRKFKFHDDVKISSLDDIYMNLFILDDYRNQKATYYTRGSIHCEIGKYRSIEDFIKLCKKYFPEEKLKTIFLFLLAKEDFYLEQGLIQSFGYCPNIRKYNFRGLSRGVYYNAGRLLNYNLVDLFPNAKNITVKNIIT